MRFRRQASPPPFLNRVDQRRLIVLGGLLLLVLVAMRIAAKPETWSWLFVGGRQAATGDAKTTKSPDRLGERAFRATVKTDGTTDSATAGRERGRLAVERSLFAKVRDNRSMERDELPARDEVLNRVAKVPADELAGAGKKDVPLSLLSAEPDRYRGRLLTISGRLGELQKRPDPHRELGDLYDAWIVTRDSGSNPYHVILSKPPAGLEPSGKYDPPPQVRVTGYFFKIERYQVNDERYHTAPLLLAKSLAVVRSEPVPSPGLGLAPWIVGFSLLVGGVLAVVLWRMSRGDKQFAESHLSRYDSTRSAEPPNLKDIQAGEDPAAFFQKLSEGESPPGE